MRYTLRQLEVFLAATYYENVTSAAKSLSMSQSAASAALKDLEQQFGVQLFDRVGKKIQVNELGRLLRPKAQGLIERAKELQDELINHENVGTLKLGATLTIGNYLAVGLMAKFIKQTPRAKIELEVANMQSIAKQVLNFDIDIGLIEGELEHPDLEINYWREDELVVFCSPRHPWVKQKKSRLSDKDLLEAHWILREEGSGTRQAFDRAMYGLRHQQIIRLELQHTEGIKRAVEADLGISCLSRIVLKDAFERGSLVPLEVPARNLRRHFYLIVHRDKYRSAGIRRLLQLCMGEENDN